MHNFQYVLIPILWHLNGFNDIESFWTNNIVELFLIAQSLFEYWRAFQTYSASISLINPLKKNLNFVHILKSFESISHDNFRSDISSLFVYWESSFRIESNLLFVSIECKISIYRRINNYYFYFISQLSTMKFDNAANWIYLDLWIVSK